MQDIKRFKKLGCILLIILFLIVGFFGLDFLKEGMRAKARKGAVTRQAASTESALHSWIMAVSKAGVDQGELNEVDTNGDGVVNEADLTNDQLAKAGVVTAYITTNDWPSPWNGKHLLISGGEAATLEDCAINAGQITLCYSGPDQGANIQAIHIVAADSEGAVLYSGSISTDKK